MNVEKKVLLKLKKCYCVAPLIFDNEKCFLVAAEKKNPCYLFDMEGNVKNKIWDKPGGTMSIVQIPKSNGQFLATQEFYSPNDSANAKIVIVTPQKDGSWAVRTLVELPFVHRFDLLASGEDLYLIACTIKSEHQHKDDWSAPGKIYAAKLPKDISRYDKAHQLKLMVIKEGLLKNHGYYKIIQNGVEKGLISAEQGVFLITPPNPEKENWKIEQLLAVPASDAVLIDIDQDGKDELVIISPFHGSDIQIYKEVEGQYQQVYAYKEKAEFSHAIYAGKLLGKPVVIIGHRGGERNLLAFTYNKKEDTYQTEFLDHNCGSANVCCFKKDGKDIIVSANRETDEIAMYLLK